MSMFDRQTYLNRRARLIQEVGDGVLLFLGNALVGMNYHDNEYPFRQDSTFLYFFGLDQPGLAAIIDIDNGEEVVFGDELTIDDIVWTGTMPSLVETAQLVGVEKTAPLSALKGRLAGRKVRFLPPYRGDHQVWLEELLGIAPAEQAVRADEAFVKAVVDQRNHKTPEEVAAIEEAVDISTRMHLIASWTPGRAIR